MAITRKSNNQPSLLSFAFTTPPTHTTTPSPLPHKPTTTTTKPTTTLDDTCIVSELLAAKKTVGIKRPHPTTLDIDMPSTPYKHPRTHIKQELTLAQGDDTLLANLCAYNPNVIPTEPVTPPTSTTSVDDKEEVGENRIGGGEVEEIMIPDFIDVVSFHGEDDDGCESPSTVCESVFDEEDNRFDELDDGFKVEDLFVDDGEGVCVKGEVGVVDVEEYSVEDVKKTGINGWEWPRIDVEFPKVGREDAKRRRAFRIKMRRMKAMKIENTFDEENENKIEDIEGEEIDKKAARAIRNREAALRSRVENKRKLSALEEEKEKLERTVGKLQTNKLHLLQTRANLCMEVYAKSHNTLTGLLSATAGL